MRGWVAHWLPAVLVGLLLAGCTHYNVTMGNGTVVRTKSKPKLNKDGFYVFKDMSGQAVVVSPMRIRQIEPVRWGGKPSFFLEPSK